MGMGFVFNIFPILFMVVFILILGVILVSLGRGVSQWHKNNQSPVLTVQAEVVTKRADVRHHHHNTGDVGAMAHHQQHLLLRYLPGGERRSNGASCAQERVRDAGGG